MKDFPFRLVEWSGDRNSASRVLAWLADFRVAQAAYQEAVRLYPGRPISLQDRARVVAKNWLEEGEPEPPSGSGT